MIASLLFVVASVVVAQHIVTSNPPNFSLFVFRLAQSGITNNGFNVTAATNTPFNGQVAVALVVNNVVTEQFTALTGADSVTPYFQRSLIDANGNVPASVVLRFNTSGLQTPIGDCALTPFASAATRTTCTLVQTVQFLGNPTPVCAVVNTPCTAPLQTNANTVNQFSVVTSTEELDARQCDTSQLFVRGVVPTCPNRIVRNTNPANLLASEAVVLKNNISPTPFTTAGKVPTTQLTRVNDYRFENPTSASLSGASRSYEAIVPASGVIPVTTRTTGFVKLLNAAHREFTSNLVVQPEASLTFVVRDQSNSNLVVHVETLSTSQQSVFIELPTGQYRFNTYSGRNPRANVTLPGQQIVGGVSADFALQVDENHYYLVVATTSTVDPTFAADVLKSFDVTPAATNTVGTTEQQVINLLLSPSLLSQDVKLLRSTVVSDSLTCTSLGGINNGQSSANGLLPAQSAAQSVEIALGSATGCASCARQTYASPATLGVLGSGCGKRVTVLIGRPYTLDTLTVTGLCTFNTTTVEIGDLAFIGTRFAFRQPVLQPVTFDIANCACTPVAPTCTESLDKCDSQRIVTLGTTINGFASGFTTTLSGISSAIGGVGNSVGVVLTGVRQVNTTVVGARTTLNNVAKDVSDIVDDIEEKNKGLQDVLDDVKNSVEDIKNDVSDVKDDLEQKNKGLIDRVKDLSDECKQSCDAVKP